MKFLYKTNLQYLIIIFIIFLAGAVPADASNSLSKKIQDLGRDPVTDVPIPVVLGVNLGDLFDTWGHARSGGRRHEGIDIVAPRGALVASPTSAVVTKIANQGFGGIQVWTANPGKQKFYYAHLDRVYPELRVGDELVPGDLIGFVGNTGNASGTHPHLHLGVYDNNYRAINPYPFLTKEFTLEQRVYTLTQYISYLQGELKRQNQKK